MPSAVALDAFGSAEHEIDAHIHAPLGDLAGVVGDDLDVVDPRALILLIVFAARFRPSLTASSMPLGDDELSSITLAMLMTLPPHDVLGYGAGFAVPFFFPAWIHPAEVAAPVGHL
jgi:hypothetical protein